LALEWGGNHEKNKKKDTRRIKCENGVIFIAVCHAIKDRIKKEKFEI